jgi:transcriptional regulator with XRE-family HTH domain
MKTVKRHTGNNWLLAIRTRLGLSQERMAEHIKISPTSFRMAEQGRRTLPTTALLQLIQLDMKLPAEPLKQEHTDLHPAEQNSLSECRRRYYFLFARESACRRKCCTMETRLKAMKILYQKTREWLHVIERSLEENRHDARAMQCWTKQQQQVIKTLSRCSLPEQVFMQSRITLLNAEAELYNNMQEQLKKELPDFFLGEER